MIPIRMGRRTVPASTSSLRELPKVELHLHLEGTLGAARIVQLAAAAGEPLPRPVDELFTVDGLDGFLAFLDWTCALVRDPEVAEQVAYDCAARADRERTRYAEVIVNPTHWRRWRVGDLVTALATGFDRAADDGLTDCRLLLSLDREQSEDDAVALVRWMADERPHRVVGLSVDGNEARAGRTGPRFAPAFRLARAEGFGCVAHAGESSGPEGVRDALDLLAVDRIDHGVRAAEDPALVTRLAGSGIVLDVCLTSNLTMLYRSLDEHPIAQLLAAGVAVTLNTDDPAYLGVGLTDEYVLAADHLGWSVEDAASCVRTAVDAAFCEPDRATALHVELDEFTSRVSSSENADT
jgi:adenosine deaminase